MGLFRYFVRYFNCFLMDKKAQGAVEYILITGAIIVAAIIFIPIYREMAGITAEKTNESVAATGKYAYNSVKREITGL